MEPSAELTEEARLTRIEGILRANKLHEANCPKQQSLQDYNPLFGSLTSSLTGPCDCWLSLDTPETDPGKALGLYHIKDEELIQGTFFRTRYHAKEWLVHTYPEVSEHVIAPNYWGKTYMIVRVTLNSAVESN